MCIFKEKKWNFFSKLKKSTPLREFFLNCTSCYLSEIVAEFFTLLFGSQANKLGADREVPKFVKILFLILAIALIAGMLFICWKILR